MHAEEEEENGAYYVGGWYYYYYYYYLVKSLCPDNSITFLVNSREDGINNWNSELLQSISVEIRLNKKKEQGLRIGDMNLFYIEIPNDDEKGGHG